MTPKQGAGKADTIAGLQWGDEGKGKVVHYLLNTGNYKWSARYQGGGNAGHTIYDNETGEKVVLHTIPSGIVCEGMDCVIGNGVVVDLEGVVKEIDELKNGRYDKELNLVCKGGKFRGKLYVSDRAHVIHPYLKELEAAGGDVKKIGTTGHAIGQTYTMKAWRKGLRMVDFKSREKVKDIIKGAIECTLKSSFPRKRFREFGNKYIDKVTDEQMELFEELSRYCKIEDTSHLINWWLREGRDGLVEGAQGTFLSVDHGTYPYVTSSNTEAGGACTGLGIGPGMIGKVIGVAKAYVTRVGRGPFPTLMPKEIEESVRQKGGEFGATTGRPRRCGWWDSVLARKSVEVNGVDEIALTKVDVLAGMGTIFGCMKYQKSGELPTYSFPADLDLDCSSDDPNSSNYIGAQDGKRTDYGWNADIRPDNLPARLRYFMEFIKDSVGAPVTILSASPKMEGTWGV